LGSTSEAFRTTICDFQNSIQPIVPTGETPARKRYSYPRNLPPQPVEEVVRLTFLTEKEGDSEEQNEDEEKEISVVDAEEENDDPLSENVELQMNESITIPDEGGIPFFKKRRGAAKTTATRSKSATRIPLRATNNNCHD
uniref:Kinesin-associated microtubule-binding domain-containing protein n=1 Tax=Ciona savignyi TaxID=51511 RepID=H2YQK1_CIOSA